MLFQIYGETSIYQLLGWVCVFAGLVLLNEVERRTKLGGVVCFIVIPAILTVYFVALAIGAKNGAAWAVNNQTVLFANGWFHYAKLYAADAGCIMFMMIKYEWWLGKKYWFKCMPFVIVAINILIAVGSDLESFFKGGAAGGWWYSSEGVWIYGGWWNLLNAIAGCINIFCMTGWFLVYKSKDKNRQDMIWPDMTVAFIVSYDIWNFTYTYLNLPTHSWYCGVALLLAPTFANAFWNKGGWIQNRANTLATWCMFAQVFPLFQIGTKFAVVPVVYGDAVSKGLDLYGAAMPTYANPHAQGVISIISLLANVIVITAIITRSIKTKQNPYWGPSCKGVWLDTKDSQIAYERAEV